MRVHSNIGFYFVRKAAQNANQLHVSVYQIKENETKKGKHAKRYNSNSKNKIVMGPCLNGQRVWKKVNLLQEIPFATQQAWHRKQRKGKKVQGQCNACNRKHGPLPRAEPSAVSRISIACPNVINGCKCCTHSTCTAVQLKTSSNGKHVIEKT